MTRPDTQPAPPPRWIAPWLALLAPLYVVSPLALVGLAYLKRLPSLALWVLGIYALSQQIPALFAPEPLLASVLALARTLLMCGLMGTGVVLADSRRLKPFALGLGLVYLTALISSVLGGADVLLSRLSHPYMTPITLGLAGALGIWIALFARGGLGWRVPLGMGGLAILLLSGSRGPLAAALLGCLAGFLLQRRRRLTLALALGAGLLAGGLYLGDRAGVAAINRLSTADTTGRDVVWYNTLTVIQAHPWSGVGSYRLGRYLEPPGDRCTLFPRTDGTAASCPAWVKGLGSPWLIAHNAPLQQLAETGPLGLLGLFVLLGAVLVACIQNASPLGLAVVSGLLVATINDNTLLLPSPFFAEVFWIVGGIQLAGLRRAAWPAGLLGAGLALTLSIPILATSLSSPSPVSARIGFLNAPERVTSPEKYQVVLQMRLPPGAYRASLSTCTSFCTNVETLAFISGSTGTPVLTFTGALHRTPTQRLELKLLPGKSSFNLKPLGLTSWTVTVGP